jgi:hypothetical protein
MSRPFDPEAQKAQECLRQTATAAFVALALVLGLTSQAEPARIRIHPMAVRQRMPAPVPAMTPPSDPAPSGRKAETAFPAGYSPAHPPAADTKPRHSPGSLQYRTDMVPPGYFKRLYRDLHDDAPPAALKRGNKATGQPDRGRP